VINQKTWVILDAHTYVFEDGSRTHGKPYALVEEIGNINYAFHGNVIILINDLRIIGNNIKTLKRKRSCMCAVMNDFFRSAELLRQLRLGCGKDVNLLLLMRLAS